MNTKSCVLVALAFYTVTGMAVPVAPEAPPAPPPQAAMWFDGLDLSAAQREALDRILEQLIEDRRLLREQFEAEVQAILTPEQFARWQASRPPAPRPPREPRPERGS